MTERRYSIGLARIRRRRVASAPGRHIRRWGDPAVGHSSEGELPMETEAQRVRPGHCPDGGEAWRLMAKRHEVTIVESELQVVTEQAHLLQRQIRLYLAPTIGRPLLPCHGLVIVHAHQGPPNSMW